MTSVTIEEAKTQLSTLVEQVEARRGGGDHHARQQACCAPRPLCAGGFGSMKGKARLDESFWEPLPDEERKLWEGG